MGKFLYRIANLQNFLKLKWLGKSKVKVLRGYILRGFNFSFSISSLEKMSAQNLPFELLFLLPDSRGFGTITGSECGSL